MSQLAFRDSDGNTIAPPEWLRMWADRFPIRRFPDEEHDSLMAKHESLSAVDFERIGRWKDAATSEGKWKPDIASVAYDIWMQAASELPRCPPERLVADFLQHWSERKHTVRGVPKRFGLARATTLLYFISGGRFPIFDSRVRRAMRRLLSSAAPNTARWYLDSYCPLFSEIVALCIGDARTVDKALFSFGDRSLTFPR